MKILIPGGAGVLGSALTELFLKKGFDVTVLDIIRPEEAWRLEDSIQQINYVWKSAESLSKGDLKETDVIIDCSIGSADRPFGITSPLHTTIGNLLPPLHILEVMRALDKKPIVIYPSSFNALCGHNTQTLTEDLLPSATSLYGWTKASAELLYLTYQKSYQIPTIITRTSSAFGPKGRSDELPHKLAIYNIQNAKEFHLKSPRSKRLWTYVGDILTFYDRLLEKLASSEKEIIGSILHVAGNKDDTIMENIQFANMIKSLSGSNTAIIEGDYEPGEIVNGEPITFQIDTSLTRDLLNWHPTWSIEDGLNNTLSWFKDNLHRYNPIK